jgi:hypothetical protein
MKRASLIAGMLLFLAASLSAQPGGPILVNFGPLNCGLRLYQPGQVQTYCILNQPPTPVSTICNRLDTIFPANGGPPPVASTSGCFATDTAGGNIYEITWMVFAARPPTTAGWITWQAVSTTQPCTFNQATGVCPPTVNTLPVTGMEQGNFPSGVATSLVGTLWYQNSEAPAVLATPGFAQSAGKGSSCTVIAPNPGIATWVSTAGGTKLEWLNDGWCPGPPGPAPAMYGDCQAETMQLKYARMIGTNAPACGVIPSEPARTLTQAYLGDPQDVAEDEAPTPQNAPISINLQAGTSYTLQPSDNGALVEFTSNSPVTLNVPSGLGAGFDVWIAQLGTGIITPTAVSPVLINQRLKLTKSAGQYALFELLATSADIFDLTGDLQ